MNSREFIAAIVGQTFKWTRRCLATDEIRELAIVTPSSPSFRESGDGGSVLVSGYHCYDDRDIFTYDFGVYVAVIKAPSGHVFCDRFVPVNETLKDDTW